MLEIVQQLADGYKSVGLLGVVYMPMVALAALVVIAHSALAPGAEVQPVFVPVSAWGQRICKPPNDDFNDGTVVSHFLCSGNLLCVHLYCTLAIYCSNAIVIPMKSIL
jgi:hypothetical protein